MRVVLVDPSRTVLKCLTHALEAQRHDVHQFTDAAPALQYIKSNHFIDALIIDETSRRGGAVYNWNSVEAAKLGHGPEFQKRIQATFGSQPEFQYFETPIVIDNTTNQVIDEAA